MDETMLANFNARVKKGDRLFVLGDFAYKAKAAYYLNRLNCKNVWLIRGNHDNRPSKREGFSEIKDYHVESYDIGEQHKKKVVMFHYPILEWDQWHRGSWHLYGHVHGQRSGPRGIHPTEYRLDIGVDCHDFKPLSLGEIAWLMATVQWEDPKKLWEKEGSSKGTRIEPAPENFRVALAELMREDFVDQWWNLPNEGFGGKSAKQVYLDGQEDRIWEMIQCVRTGHPL
jgi:calcineurin-like phosphoesterase family protein